MPPTSELLRRLPLRLDAASCATAHVDVPSYPDEPRPTSVVTLTGGGHAGRGEHVGWTTDAHAAFGRAVTAVRSGTSSLGEWIDTLAPLPRYDRAALEAAAIDLALRQRGTNLFRLTDTRPTPVRYVVSFGPVPDPAAEARRQGDVELKIDVDAGWEDDVVSRLPRVAVIDWKLGGTRAEHERVHRLLPDALVEDPSPAAAPWSPALTRRLSADGTVERAGDVARLSPRPVAVNLKPGRMGSVLAMLDAADACRALGIDVYVGGMFELGCGRTQLRTLAALLSPSGPNDIAPIPTAEHPAARPERLPAPADVPGFGDHPA